VSRPRRSPEAARKRTRAVRRDFAARRFARWPQDPFALRGFSARRPVLASAALGSATAAARGSAARGAALRLGR
jgi:hypothetical protein